MPIVVTNHTFLSKYLFHKCAYHKSFFGEVNTRNSYSSEPVTLMSLAAMTSKNTAKLDLGTKWNEELYNQYACCKGLGFCSLEQKFDILLTYKISIET